MPPQVIEAYTGAALTRGRTDGEWSAVRVFQVTGSTSKNDALSLVAAAGVVQGSTHPDQSRLICNTCACDDGLVLRKVTASYTIPDLGQFDPDPLKAKTVWKWVPGTITEPTDRDFYGNPNTNSAHIPWDQPSQAFYGTMELTATRNEPFYNAQKALAIQNTTNSDTFTVQGGGVVLPGQAFLVTMGNEGLVYDGVTYARITYTFRMRKGNLIDGTDEYDAFWEHRLDQGDAGYLQGDDGNRLLGLVCNKKKMTVGTVKFDGTGKPLDTALQIMSVDQESGKVTIGDPIASDPLPAEVKTVTRVIDGKKIAVFLVRRQFAQLAFLSLNL